MSRLSRHPDVCRHIAGRVARALAVDRSRGAFSGATARLDTTISRRCPTSCRPSGPRNGAPSSPPSSRCRDLGPVLKFAAGWGQDRAAALLTFIDAGIPARPGALGAARSPLALSTRPENPCVPSL
jgi:hypothetical protein